MSVRQSLVYLAGAMAALTGAGVAFAQCGSAPFPNPVTCTSTGTVTLTDNDIVTQPVKATNGYPSSFTIPSTVTGTVSNIVVRLNGLTASATGQGGADQGISSLGLLLVHGSQALEILYSPGDANEDFSNVAFYISDSAVSGVTLANTFGFMPTSGDPTACGTTPVGFNPSTDSGVNLNYRPSSYGSGITSSTYPAPAPASFDRSGPCIGTAGANTLNGVFAGTAAAGVWDLYVEDVGIADVSFTSWSLIITTAVATTTTTTLNTSLNPSFTATPNNSVTLTADLTSGSGTPNTGTVAFSDGAAGISGCAGVPVSGSGVATCTTTFTTEGFHSLSAMYSGGGSFATSTGTLNQFVKNHSTLVSGQYCNTGPINVGTPNASGTDTQPYPSIINVGTDTTGIAQSVSTVQLVLKGFSTSDTLDLSMLLVSPDRSHTLDFFDFVGGGVATPSTTVTFSDGASGQAPNGSGALASPTASYQATSYRSSTSFTPPSFLDPPTPAPQVPGSFNIAAPGGGTSSKNFLEAFNGATADGDWTLYVYDHGQSNTSSIATGWCLSITPGVGLSTTTTVSGSPNAAAPNGATTGTPVTVTATVKNGSTPVTTGSVTFTENGKPVTGGPTVPVNVTTSGANQGKASFTTSSLPQGDHTILATFTDSTNTFSESFGTYVQRVDNATTFTVNGTAVTYCNVGKVTVPDPNNANPLGAGTPNPSNINVGNLFGTVKTVTVSLNGYSEGEPNFLTSLLVGPTAATFDFFSGAGGPNAAGPFNLLFSDSGVTLVPQNSPPSAGTFKPTAYNRTDTFTASTSGLYTLPGTINYAAPNGTSTFATVYMDTNPNGNWDLYFNQTGDNPGGGLATGWCLNFTENAPVLTIAKAHTGNFVQGQQGAQFAITVSNSGPGSAGGAIGVTVTDTLPIGLTPAASPGSGTDWNCSSAGQTITCTNADLILSGSSFPSLTLNVNVATNAPTSVSNTAAVNGSGNTVAVNSNANSVTIVPAPFLAISKSPSGTFTQGQTALWNLMVSNTAPSSMTAGTVTVVDTLPTGYTLASFAGTGWTCGAVTVTVTCTSTTAVSGGNSYPTLGLTVNVPANSSVSVTNNAVVFGGGDLSHTSVGTAATTFSTVTVVQVPATINLTAGNNQSAAVTTTFTTNLSVTVLDAGNVAINNATVTFTAPAGGASGTFAGGTNVKTAQTNISGVATATAFTANTTAGSYNVIASAGSTTNSFSLTNNPGPASHMAVNAGTTPQSTTVNTAFTNALAVTVTDAHSNPVSGVSVQFTAPAATGPSGLFSNSTVQISVPTNTSGVASAPFTANGNAGGPYSVTASATGVTAVSFSLMNLAGSAGSITANAGATPQSATVNTAFTNALAVTVLDSFSNPVSGANVVFTAPSTGASGTFVNSTNTISIQTNGSGVASAGIFTANGTPGGPYTVTATVGALTANFSLNNTAVLPSGPTVVSYKVLWGIQSFNVIGAARNRLPWQITGIQVVFSAPITTGNVNSLGGTGVTTTGFSGLGTNTLTWTISPLALGNFPTVLAGSGANALKDSGGNGLTNGAGFSQNLKILYGDFNDDGVVNSQDLVLELAAINAVYNIFADMNGDGAVTSADYLIVRTRSGTSLP